MLAIWLSVFLCLDVDVEISPESKAIKRNNVPYYFCHITKCGCKQCTVKLFLAGYWPGVTV